MAEHITTTDATTSPAQPQIRTLSLSDLRAALAAGWRDFKAEPSHPVFLSLVYILICFLMVAYISGRTLWPYLYPLAGGFAFVGPVAAIGLYELSRRRETRDDVRLREAFSVFHAKGLWAIIVLGLLLGGVFILWLAAAREILSLTLGESVDTQTLSGFLSQVLTTSEGWSLIIIGNAVGAVFAVVVLAVSAVSFPYLLDRGGSPLSAVATSLRVCLKNPKVMAVWGLVVAAAMVASFVTLGVGLAVMFPLLGHATWHLYRRAIV